MKGAAQAAVLAGLACGACAETRAERSAVAEWDSAGVRIVESRLAADASPVLRLSVEPRVQIGVVEGAPEYQLDGIQWLTRLTDGTLVVASGGSREIRFYDSAGRHRHTAGRAGAGPGEYRSIGYMRRLAGDTLLVFDALNRRISILDPTGGYVRGISTAGEQPLRVAAALEDGTLLVGGGASARRGLGSAELLRDTVSYEVVRGEQRRPIEASFLGGERRLQVSEQGGAIVAIEITALPFSRNALTASTPAHFIIGSNYTYSLHIIDATGSVRTIIRRPDIVPRPVSDELIEHDLQARLERQRAARQVPDEAALRKQMQSWQRVDAVPTFTDVLGTEDGGVWVKDWRPPWETPHTDRWSVFAADGRLRGAVDVPSGYRPLYLDDDVVIGVIRDELDVEYVRVYTLDG